MYRLFIAIDIPEEIENSLVGICRGIPGVKWTPRNQFHLTLRFIGEVEGGMFRDIGDALGDVVFPEFSIKLRGTGTFPPGRVPKVLWTGVEDKLSLVKLHNSVDSALSECGVPRDRRKFHPHITLARLKKTPESRVAGYLSEYARFSTKQFTVNKFYLYSSILNPGGAVHNIEAAYPLTRRT